jgi:hypothetical protein
MERFEGVVEAAGRGGHLVEIPLDVPTFSARSGRRCAAKPIHTTRLISTQGGVKTMEKAKATGHEPARAGVPA